TAAGTGRAALPGSDRTRFRLRGAGRGGRDQGRRGPRPHRPARAPADRPGRPGGQAGRLAGREEPRLPAVGVTRAAVLAIDGGNSKTEVALAAADGTILACVQVGGFTPHLDGMAGAVSVAGQGVALIRAELGLPADEPLAELLAAYVAGADFPVEVEALTAEF